MFAWTTSAKKVFRTIPEDLFEKTKVLAANQGLYNGFLSAGLLWSLAISDKIVQMDFNHPLAGHDLHFIGEILNVRNATNEELSHGHVHGPGGHHH